jgi:hypothetical protein
MVIKINKLAAIPEIKATVGSNDLKLGKQIFFMMATS